MSNSLGAGRSARPQLQALQEPLQQNMMNLGAMQYAMPQSKEDTSGLDDILKLLEKYWKTAF